MQPPLVRPLWLARVTLFVLPTWRACVQLPATCLLPDHPLLKGLEWVCSPWLGVHCRQLQLRSAGWLLAQCPTLDSHFCCAEDALAQPQCRQEGMPFFIRWIIGYQVSQYRKKVWQPFERECLQASPSA